MSAGNRKYRQRPPVYLERRRRRRGGIKRALFWIAMIYVLAVVIALVF